MASNFEILTYVQLRTQTGNNMSSYNEKVRRWTLYLTVVSMHGTLVWISTRSKIVKWNILTILQSPTKDVRTEAANTFK